MDHGAELTLDAQVLQTPGAWGLSEEVTPWLRPKAQDRTLGMGRKGAETAPQRHPRQELGLGGGRRVEGPRLAVEAEGVEK